MCSTFGSKGRIEAQFFSFQIKQKLYVFIYHNWKDILLEKLRKSWLVKKFPAFMEPTGSLLHLQKCPDQLWSPPSLLFNGYWGHEADHSALSNAKVKNVWGYTLTPPTRLHGVVLS
jgi:hypothetical protein